MVWNLDGHKLEDIAHKVWFRITGGKGTTLDDYFNLAVSKKGDEIGLGYLWILKNTPALRNYFPDEIFKVLLDKKGRHYYTPEDLNTIKNDAQYGIKYLVLKINVPPASIYKQARLMGVSIPRITYPFFDKKETKQILDLVENGLTDRQISEIIHRPIYSVQHKRLKEGKIKRKLFYWSEHPKIKRDVISLHRAGKSYTEIAEIYKLTYFQVKTFFERIRKIKS